VLRGNRNLLVAVGLVAVIAAAIAAITFPRVPALKAYSYGEPGNAHYRPGGGKCEPSTLAAIADLKVRLSQADDCQKQAEEYRQNTSDLIQQIRAADAAEAQAQIASQGLWTAWFQTIGGFITLAAAIAAAVYARDAAKETRRSAEIAEANYRAFVRFESAVITVKFEGAPSFFSEDGKRYIRFKIICSNKGRTAAFVTGVKVQGREPTAYSFICEPGSDSTFTRSHKVCIDDLSVIRGYVQYSDHVEFSKRRIFKIDVRDSFGGVKNSAKMFDGGLLRKGDERYDDPFQEQGAHS